MFARASGTHISNSTNLFSHSGYATYFCLMWLQFTLALCLKHHLTKLSCSELTTRFLLRYLKSKPQPILQNSSTSYYCTPSGTFWQLTGTTRSGTPLFVGCSSTALIFVHKGQTHSCLWEKKHT